MIRIEHVAFWTEQLDTLADFYATHFGARVGPRFEHPPHGFASRFLEFEGGARIELMQTSQLQPVRHAPGAQRMGLTHLAIAVGSEQAVDTLTAAIAAAGHPVPDAPHRTSDGYYESVVLDPDGNRVEITV